MRVLRVVLTGIVTATIAGVLGTGPAQAGGGSTFEFDEKLARADYLVVGQAVTGTMWGYFEDRELEGEQFYAYLERVERAGGAWDAPPKLSPAARPLGPITVGPFERGCCGGYEAQATITFTVPSVEPGRYVIEYCNSPCTKVFGSSSNMETWIEVVASPMEARLRHRIDRLDAQLRSEIWRDDRWERRRIKDLFRTINGGGGLVSDSETMRTQSQDAVRRVAGLEAQVSRLTAKVQDDGTPWLAYAFGVIGLAALAVIVLRVNRKPTEVNVSLVEQADPGSRSWKLGA